jgi:hypothetical protein
MLGRPADVKACDYLVVIMYIVIRVVQVRTGLVSWLLPAPGLSVAGQHPPELSHDARCLGVVS